MILQRKNEKKLKLKIKLAKLNGAPERIRTSDRLVRSQVLYPAELRAHIKMAVSEGFEPSIEFPLYALSRGAPSATRPTHLTTAHILLRKILNEKRNL